MSLSAQQRKGFLSPWASERASRYLLDTREEYGTLVDGAPIQV
ncbi:hypothetical protein [Singulisphaera sp. GP187]|nr:hypothetical protein [Singulisphaera sp. GP187]